MHSGVRLSTSPALGAGDVIIESRNGSSSNSNRSSRKNGTSGEWIMWSVYITDAKWRFSL